MRITHFCFGAKRCGSFDLYRRTRSGGKANVHERDLTAAAFCPFAATRTHPIGRGAGLNDLYLSHNPVSVFAKQR